MKSLLSSETDALATHELVLFKYLKAKLKCCRIKKAFSFYLKKSPRNRSIQIKHYVYEVKKIIKNLISFYFEIVLQNQCQKATVFHIQAHNSGLEGDLERSTWHRKVAFGRQSKKKLLSKFTMEKKVAT
jgi:hypothetical protein